jgi:hypothetical protein
LISKGKEPLIFSMAEVRDKFIFDSKNMAKFRIAALICCDLIQII